MAETAVVGRGLVEILPDFRKWSRQLAADMKVANKQLDGSSAGLKASAATVGASMAKIGKGASLVGLGVAAASLKMAGDFQAHTAVLQTAAGETSKGLAVVRKGILNIGQDTGTPLARLTDGMYTVEKAGFRGANGLKVLKAAAQGAREENANLADVTNAMTSVMASYHLKATDSVRVMNAMKTAAGEGKITMEEFSGALSTVLPIASANKISFEQVAGSMATLTQHGTSAREATHELAATIRALASPNNVATREMAKFGLSATDVSIHLGQRGLSGTMNLLVETILRRMGPAGHALQKTFEGSKQSAQDVSIMLSKMSGQTKEVAQEYLKGQISIGDWNKVLKGIAVDQRPMLQNFKALVDRSKGFSSELKRGGPAEQTFTDALKKMSGGAIGLNTILQLTGESAAGNAERIRKVGESFHNNSKDVEGWKVTQNLLNVQLDRAKVRMQVLAVEIGTKLIPIVTAIVKFFTQYKGVTLALVGGIITLIGVLSAAYIASKIYAGYTIVATAAQTAWTIATLAQTDSLMILRAQLALLWIMEKAQAIATGVATAAQWAFNAAMDATPITLVIIGVTALVAGIVYLATRTQFFQKLWATVWGFMKTVVLGFVRWLKSNWQLVVWTILTGGIGLAVAMIVRHWDGVKHAFSVTIDWIKHNWPLLLAILAGPIGLAVLYIVRHWDAIKKGAESVYHAVVDWFVRMGEDIGTFFTKLPGQIARFFTQTLPDFFVSAGKTIGDFFKKLPGQIAQAATGFGKVFVKSGGDLISGLFKGATDFFTHDIPNFFKTLWHGLVDFFKAVFGIHSPSTVMASLGMDLIRGLLQGMLKIAVTLTQWLGDHIGKPIIDLFTQKIPDAARTFWTKVSQYWGNLRDFVTKAWGALKRDAIDPVIHFFTVSIPNAGKTLKDAVLGFIRTLVVGALDGFGLIIKGAAKLFGWVPGVGGKLKGAVKAFDKFRDDVNKALGGINGKNVNVGANFKVSNFVPSPTAQRRAGGGSIDGPGTDTSDDVPIWASKGEHMWAAREVRAVGGHAAMLRLRKLAVRGLLRGYASGGPIRGYAAGGEVEVHPRVTPFSVIKSLAESGLVQLLNANARALWDQYISMQSAGPSFIGLGGVGKSAAAAMAYAQKLLNAHIYGWTMSQWPSWRSLGMGESGWRWNALNASSGAYGIPQALPAGKMASAGADWRTNALTQVRWMATYIHSVYGNPANAWSRWLSRSPHWYDQGGLAQGIGAFFKRTNAPERVLSPRQTEAFEHLVGSLTHGGSGLRQGVVIQRVELHNHGVIGSRHETENWLVNSFDQLQRQGRIRVITRPGGK